MRFLAMILLFTGLLSQLGQKHLMMLDYAINKGTYRLNCINKDRPLLHCDGKCQLAKKWDREEKDEKQGFSQRFQQVLFPPVAAATLKSIPTLRIIHAQKPTPGLLQGFQPLNDRPPAVIS